jgi:hypothetical protein
MLRVLPVALLAACSFTSGAYSGDAQPAPDDAVDGLSSDADIDAMVSPLRAKTITGGTITGTHVDFPLWVVLDDTDLGIA